MAYMILFLHIPIIAFWLVVLAVSPGGSVTARYSGNVLLAYDQLANAYGGGDPDESISSVAAKRPGVWYWRLLGRFLEWIDPGHMARSVERDEGADAGSHPNLLCSRPMGINSPVRLTNN